MLGKLRSHLTYANVMATIALFLALGGGVAWALEVNTVRSKHIAPNTLRAADLADSSVGTSEIAPDSVTAEDLGPIVTVENQVTYDARQGGYLDVECPTDTQLISGGASIGDPTNPEASASPLTASYRTESGNGWRGGAFNGANYQQTLSVYAYCLS